jgi:hypothetical protein
VNSGKHVYFVRAQVILGDETDISREHTAALVELIKNKFPQLQFTFIVAHYTEEFKVDWHMPHVINFYHTGRDDEEARQQWKKVFQDIGLIS